jgi:hypothetical protein
VHKSRDRKNSSKGKQIPTLSKRPKCFGPNFFDILIFPIYRLSQVINFQRHIFHPIRYRQYPSSDPPSHDQRSHGHYLEENQESAKDRRARESAESDAMIFNPRSPHGRLVPTQIVITKPGGNVADWAHAKFAERFWRGG